MNRVSVYMLLLAVLLAMFVNTASAALNRQEKIDSIINVLPKLKEDTNKVILMDFVAAELSYIDAAKGMQYSQMELALAKKLNWRRGIGLAYVAIGYNYEATGDIPNCVNANIEAIKYFEETGLRQGIGVAYSTIGNLYLQTNIYDKAIENSFKAIKIFEELKDTANTARMHANIGGAYLGLKNYDKSLKYYREAQREMIWVKDSFNLGIVYGDIGSVYFETSDYNKSLDYSRISLSIFNRLDDEPQISHALGQIGKAYYKLKDIDEALDYIYRSILIKRKLNIEYELADNLGVLGTICLDYYKDSGVGYSNKIIKELYGSKSLLTIADSAFNQALRLEKKYGSLENAMVVYKQLSEINKIKGDYKKAFDFYQEYTTYKDSVDRTRNTEKIAKFENERALLIKQRQIEEDQRKSKERLFFISITVLLLIIIIIVVRNFYKQRTLTKQKEDLANQKELLIQDKDVLIKEIHHRVKNNLQVVVSLLDLQTGNTNDEVAKRAMTESAVRVKSISLIHRFLYQNDNITSIEFNNFIKELFAQVYIVFKSPGQQISLNENVPLTYLDIDTAVPLGLILNELLVNSFKYAFLSKNGHIDITLEANDEGYVLQFSDSGPGLGGSFDIKMASTMGMTIMRNLSKQLGGKIYYDNYGNKFIISFKDVIGRKKIK